MVLFSKTQSQRFLQSQPKSSRDLNIDKNKVSNRFKKSPIKIREFLLFNSSAKIEKGIRSMISR